VSYVVLNVHAPTEDKIDDVKDSFYKGLQCVLDKFPKYHMKILLGESLDKIINDNGVRAVNLPNLKISRSKV
jgi:hypothetical protein